MLFLSFPTLQLSPHILSFSSIPPHTPHPLLPLIHQVRHWLMEIGDDPFEVKLRYNYELLEDEYQEGCKRLKALDARVSPPCFSCRRERVRKDI